jgi:hypothetical protein
VAAPSVDVSAKCWRSREDGPPQAISTASLHKPQQSASLTLKAFSADAQTAPPPFRQYLDEVAALSKAVVDRSRRVARAAEAAAKRARAVHPSAARASEKNAAVSTTAPFLLPDPTLQSNRAAIVSLRGFASR